MAGAAFSSTALETGAEGTPAALAGSALAAAPSAAEAAEAQAAAAVETPLLVQTAGSVAAPTGKQAKRHAATSFALRPAEPCSNASAIAPAVSRCDATSAADTGTLTLHTTPKRMWSNLEREQNPVEGGQDVGEVSPLRVMVPMVPSPHHF